MQQLLVKNKPLLISIVHHPIERGNVTIVEVPFRHQSIQQLKEHFTGDQEILVGLDSEQILPAAWRNTHVGPGSQIVFLPAAAGPVLSWVAATIWAALPTMAIAFGFAYLGGMLFGPDMKQPPRREREESQSFGWNPVTTQRADIPHPLCYGTNLHHGNIVARWTDVDESGNELLYMILDYGRGPVKGKGANIVYFNDQPVGNFPGVTIQERLGTLNQTAMTGFEQNKLESRPGWRIDNSGDLAGPVTFVTPNNFFDDLEYTIEFPRGLWHYGDDGERRTHGVGVKVEISERSLGAWTTLLNTTINGNQLTPVYKAYRANAQVADVITHGKQYDLKITKTTSDESADKWGDVLQLRSVREVVDVAFTRPGKALLGITALATERLSGHLTIKWVADDKLVNIYNGSTWDVGFTVESSLGGRNRAWVVLDELTQPVISGDGGANPWTIERYDGLDPSRIDLAFFYEWAQWCDGTVPSGKPSPNHLEYRMPCDIMVDWQTDVWSLAYELAQVGRMYPYWQGNILTGWVDKAVTGDPFDLVTFDNIMVKSWRSSWAGFGELAGSVEVYFRDAQHGYDRKGWPVHNELAGLYTRKIPVEGTGVTGHALATRVGNHALTRNKLIKNINSVRMFKDALRYRLGKVVRLQSNVPNWGESYRVIESEADNTVELDRMCTASPDDIIYVRSYDEANKQVDISSYTVVSVVEKVVTIAETWDVTPIKNNIVAIGIAGAIKLRRITKMRHAVNNYFDVTFETYDADLFDSDSIEPSIPNPDYAWPQPAPDLAKPASQQWVIDVINQMLPPSPDIDIPWTSNLDWTGSGGDTVSWSKRNADEPILFRYRGTTYQITPDSTTDEFIYWDPNYTDQFRTTNTASVALAAGMWLMCTNKAGVAHAATPMQLIHAAILLAGTIRAEMYAELRNTYVYDGDDSLDSSHPFEIPFRVVSEMTAIQSVRLSFRLMPYRAYSTAAASGGSSSPTSEGGGGQTSSGASGWPWIDYTGLEDPGLTDNEALGSHHHSQYQTDDEDCGGGVHQHNLQDTDDENLGSHRHYHTGTHKHTVNIDDHTHTVSNHTHQVNVPAHGHGVTYGLHEESNSPTVHFHIDNGSGFGGASADYNSDQIDLVITGSITGTGWKAIRFDTNLRCRVAAIIECKLDITA